MVDPGGGIPSRSQIRLLEKMLTLLDFRPENRNLVIVMSTISMCQNCSISFLVDLGGAKRKFAHLAHPRYNYDMQSKHVHESKMCLPAVEVMLSMSPYTAICPKYYLVLGLPKRYAIKVV